MWYGLKLPSPGVVMSKFPSASNKVPSSLTPTNTLSSSLGSNILFKVNPIPSTIGTPPGPAGGVIISQSSGKILRYHDKADKIAGLANQIARLEKILIGAAGLIMTGLATALLHLID